MWIPLLIGFLTVLFTMGIQVTAVVFMLRYLLKIVSEPGLKYRGMGFDTYVISIVLLVLFVGHLFQVAVWAGLFLYLGEFEDFATAFYHSMVNFASLGYGDIVMSEEHRLLGALEAANGVLMFGLSAGAILSVMNGMFARHKVGGELKEKMRQAE